MARPMNRDVPAPAVVVDEQVLPVQVTVAPVTPNVTVTQLSELDAHIQQRQVGQPTTLAEVEARVERIEERNKDRHRLTLPEFFEQRSYDHAPKLTTANGKYVFRWLFKEKRAIDRALNDLGWTLVNRTLFPDAPKYLFSANGGVEVGDSLLAFMPAKRALAIRAEPGLKSRARLEARMTTVGREADTGTEKVLMTGNPKDPRVYMPEGGAVEEVPAGVGLMEGRDF